MGLFYNIRWWLTWTWWRLRADLWFILPFLVIPLLKGFVDGVTWWLWRYERDSGMAASLQDELDSVATWSYFDVPGTLSFNDYQEQNHVFKTKRIHWNNFIHTLGITKPVEHSDPMNSLLTDMVAFDGIMRDTTTHATHPKQIWIYVSGWGWPEIDPWDEAFNTFVQELYVKPLPLDTKLFWLDCSRSLFMCTAWNVKGPSLIHLNVEERNPYLEVERNTYNPDDEHWLTQSNTMDYSYRPPHAWLRPITARVVELPLEHTKSLLPSTTFPSEYTQLTTLILNHAEMPEFLYTHFPPWDYLTQNLNRFTEHNFELIHRTWPRRTIQYYMSRLNDLYDDWVVEELILPLTESDRSTYNEVRETIELVALITTFVGATIVHWPLHWGYSWYTWYFGLRSDGTPIMTESVGEVLEADKLMYTGEEAEAHFSAGLPRGGNFMEDLFMGGIEHVFAKAEENYRSKGPADVEDRAKAAVTGAGEAVHPSTHDEERDATTEAPDFNAMREMMIKSLRRKIQEIGVQKEGDVSDGPDDEFMADLERLKSKKEGASTTGSRLRSF